MRKTKYILFALLLLVSMGATAQKAERSSVRHGNKLYEKKKYTEAEIAYRKALEVNPKSKEGAYNLGNALYKQEKGKEALEQYQLALNRENNPLRKAAIFHNSGNTFMASKEYDKAVSAYQMSMRLNPNDNETRYNLAMAQALLKKQQQQQKQNKDQNKKDNKKDDKKDQKQQQKQDDQEKKQNKDQKKDQQKQQQEQVSKEKAQQLLDALSQDEKDTQEKVKKLQMQQSKPRKTDKDW